MLHVLQLQSNRVFRVSRASPSSPSAKLISIKHAAAKKPSGKRFFLQVSGTHKYKARECYGELRSVASTGFGPLSPFGGRFLSVGTIKECTEGLNQVLEVSTADKVDVDVHYANVLLTSEALLLEFRYKTDIDESSCHSIRLHQHYGGSSIMCYSLLVAFHKHD